MTLDTHTKNCSHNSKKDNPKKSPLRGASEAAENKNKIMKKNEAKRKYLLFQVHKYSS